MTLKVLAFHWKHPGLIIKVRYHLSCLNSSTSASRCIRRCARRAAESALTSAKGEARNR